MNKKMITEVYLPRMLSTKVYTGGTSDVPFLSLSACVYRVMQLFPLSEHSAEVCERSLL